MTTDIGRLTDDQTDGALPPGPADDYEMAVLAYEDAYQRVEMHRDTYAGILAQLATYEGELREAKARVETIAKEQRKGFEDDLFLVTYTERKSRWLDVDYILANAPHVKDIPGIIKTTTTVDTKKIEALAKGDMIPREVVEAAQREKVIAVEVKIKPLKGEAK